MKYLIKTLFKNSEDVHLHYTFKDGNPNNCSVSNIIPKSEYQLMGAKNRLLGIFKTEDPSPEELSPNEKYNRFIISKRCNSENKLEDCKIRLHNTVFKKDIPSADNSDTFKFLDHLTRFFNMDIASDDKTVNRYHSNRIIDSDHNEISTQAYGNIQLGGFAYSGSCAWLNGFSGVYENIENDNM